MAAWHGGIKYQMYGIMVKYRHQRKPIEMA